MITLEIPFDYKVQCYLQINKLTAAQPDDYLIVYDQEDGTPSISNWNTKNLGDIPTIEDLDAAFEQNQNNKIAYSNKYMAQLKLSQTDWSQYADVSNIATNPRLLNKESFDAYRLQLRSILVSPPNTVIEFPAVPKAIWSK